MASSRRSFLRNSLACTASATVLPVFNRDDPPGKPRIKLSISSYSYWHFKEKKFPIEGVIDEAAKLGVEGLIFFTGKWTAKTMPISTN
jgi:L-ribulose-5-phosphate 3-epimerase